MVEVTFSPAILRTISLPSWNSAQLLLLPKKSDSLSYTKKRWPVAIKDIASFNSGVLGSLPNSTGVPIDAVTSSNRVASRLQCAN